MANNYFNYYFNTAPTTKEALNNVKVPVVDYQLIWENNKPEYKWVRTEKPMATFLKEYVYSIPSKRPVERKVSQTIKDKTVETTVQTYKPTPYEFLKRFIVEEPNEITRRQAWAHFRQCVEQVNQAKIDNAVIWKTLAKTDSLESYTTKLNLTDKAIRTAELRTLNVFKDTARLAYFKDILLTKAEDFGVTPKELQYSSKDVYTVTRRGVAEDSDDAIVSRAIEQSLRYCYQKMNLELLNSSIRQVVTNQCAHYKTHIIKLTNKCTKMYPIESSLFKTAKLAMRHPTLENYWLRPWTTYQDFDEESRDPIITIVGRHTQTITPSFMEEEAVQIADWLARYGNEFKETVEVWDIDYQSPIPDMSKLPVFEAIYAICRMKPEVITKVDTSSIFAKSKRFVDYTSSLASIDYDYPELLDQLNELKGDNIVLTTLVSMFTQLYNQLLDTPLSEYSYCKYGIDVSKLKDCARRIISEYSQLRRIDCPVPQSNLVKTITRDELRLNDEYEEFNLEFRDFQYEASDYSNEEELLYDCIEDYEPLEVEDEEDDILD
jgi:hypothetical protein